MNGNKKKACLILIFIVAVINVIQVNFLSIGYRIFSGSLISSNHGPNQRTKDNLLSLEDKIFLDTTTSSNHRPAQRTKSNFSSLEKIHNLIWKQIEILQESGDCEQKKFLHCEPKKNYAGFGSLVQRYGACIQVAFGLGRTFFIHQPQYDHFGGLSEWLLPESKKCGYMKQRYTEFSDVCDVHNPKCYQKNGYELNNTYKVLIYSPEPGFPAPRRIPGTIPVIIETALKELNIPDPKMWFTAQFVGYLLLRKNNAFIEKYENISKEIKLNYPYVSMHIRHGDKIGKESQYIPEKQFVEAVDRYFNTTSRSLTPRNLFIASDDESIRSKLEKEIIPGTYSIKMLPEDFRKQGFQSYFHDQFPKEVIGTILTDIYFLVQANFTVCTYTSNVCCLVNLLKQSTYPFIAEMESLDDDNIMSYHFYGHGYDPIRQKKMYITIRDNSNRNIIINDQQLLMYRKGIIFKEHGSVNTSNVLSVTNDYVNGLVFINDVVRWPGNPSYYFY